MRFLFTLLATAMTLGLAACGTDTDIGEGPAEATYQLEIAHYMVPCEGAGRQLCMLGTKSTGETELVYSGIEGFDFEWGQRVVIEIREETVPNPPQDGSSIRLILEDVVSAEQDRGSFDLELQPGDLRDTANGLSLMGLVPIECASPEICATVEAQMDGNTLSVKARAGEDPSDPIQVFRIM